MAALPPSISLRKEDFPNNGIPDRPTLDKLLRPLVNFSKLVADGFAGQLTVDGNLAGELIPISFTTPASDWTPITLLNNFGALGSGWPVPSYRITESRKCELKGLFNNPSTIVANVTLGTIPLAAMPPDATASTGRLFAVPGETNGAAPGSRYVCRFDIWQDGVNTLLKMMGATYYLPASTGTATLYGVLDGISWDVASPGILSCFPFTVQTKISQPRAVCLVDLTGGPAFGSAVVVPVNRPNSQQQSLEVRNIPGLALNTKYTGTLLVLK